jgi:hypothetical protein
MSFPVVTQSAQASTASGTSLTLNFGSAPAVSDVLVACFNLSQFSGSRDLILPSGWTLLDSVVNIDNRIVTIYRVAGAGEPSSFTFNFTGTAQTHSAVLLDVNGATGISAHTAANSQTTTLIAPNTGDFPLAFFVQNNGASSGNTSNSLSTTGWTTDQNNAPSFHATVAGHGPATTASVAVAPAISWGGTVQNPMSAIVILTSPAATIPDPPTGVSASAGNSQAGVSWVAPSNNGGLAITGYDVQYSSDGGSTWTSASASFHTSTSTTQTVTGLTNGALYIFRVAAINAVGQGSYSSASGSVTPTSGTVAYRTSSSVVTRWASLTTTPVVNAANGIQNGDLLLMIFEVGSALPAVTMPSGWSVLATLGDGTNSKTVYAYKVATASEPATYSPTLSSAATGTATVVAYTGADPGAPIVVESGGSNNPNGTTVPTGTLPDSYVSPSILVALYSTVLVNAGTLTAPAGFTPRSSNPGTNGHAQLVADEASPAPGSPISSQPATLAPAGFSNGLILVIRPASVQTPTVKNSSATSLGTATTTVPSIPPPAGYVPGSDLLVATVVWAGTQGISGAPAGWALVGGAVIQDAGAGVTMAVYTKLADGSSNDSFTATLSSSVINSDSVTAISGAKISGPIDVQASTGQASGTSLSIPAVTTTLPNETVLYVVGISSTNTTISAAGTTTAVREVAANSPALGVFYESQAAAGTTTARTATAATSSHWVARTLALKSTYTPPSAPALTAPANASYQDLAVAGNQFTWTPSFNTAGDSQSAYALRRKIGTGAYEYWNASTALWQAGIVWNPSATSSVTFPAGKWVDGNVYNWSVATQGALGPGGAGSQGPFAADLTVTASATPTVTITMPVGTSASATPLVSWTETVQTGASQTSYRVIVTNSSTGAVVWDSGVVASAATSVNVGTLLTSGVTYNVSVQITETGGQTSASANSTFTASFDSPATPSITSAVWDNVNARVALTIQGWDNILTLDDSSFETTIGTWVAQTNTAAPARTTSQFTDGVASMQLTSSAAGDMTARTAQGTLGYAVMPNKQYNILASFRAAANPRTCTVTVNWWQASGAASAVRASDTSVGVVDATGAWSANAVLTVVSPSDAAFCSISVTVAGTGAAGEVHYVDKVDIGPGSTAPWTIGGFAATGAYTIEASEDGGLTWRAVRGGPFRVDSASNQVVSAYDYERTPGARVTYRARVSNILSGSTVTSANSSLSATVTISMDSWWVKDVNNPALNMKLCDAQQNVRTRRGDSVAIYPAGRTNPIVLRGPVHGASSTFRTTVSTEADRTAVLAVMTAQDSILIQDPKGHQWYAEWVGDLTESAFPVDQSMYAIQRSWVEVDVPG